MPQVGQRLRLRHETVAQWARQMIRVVRRWLPRAAITVLGNQAYSVVELGHACRRCGVRLNPLRQNYRHVRALEEALAGIGPSELKL